MDGGEHKALLEEMVFALRSELGATYVYPALLRRARDEGLSEVLSDLHTASLDQVERLRSLMLGLGARPAKRRLRRLVAARALTLVTPFTGLRLPLRLCADAEGAVSRWYAGYAVYFARLGDEERAGELHELSQAKYRHALALQTWVHNLPYRRFL